MTDLTRLTLAEARDGLKAQALLRRELTQAHIDAVEAARALNAFVLETPEQALEHGARPPTRGWRRARRGPLEGVPLGIKDLFCTEGVRTTACSNILGDFVPPYEFDRHRQPLARRRGDARQAQHGRVRHGLVQRDLGLRPGGQPLAARGLERRRWRRAAPRAARPRRWRRDLCLGATATDTGGSIRQPAAFTGTVGIKPTYGRCSRWGIVAFASSLDQAGPIAQTVRDARHPAALHGRPRSEGHHLGRRAGAGLRGRGRQAASRACRSACPRNTGSTACRAEIEALWQQGIAWLKDAGAEIVEVSLPHTKYALPAYYIVAPAEASSNLARYDGVRYGLRVPGRDIDRHVREDPRRGLRRAR